MWFFTLLTLRRSTSRSLLASTGFLLAACALILLSATTQTTVVQASAIINRNWRPAYDLVVLPPQAVLPPGKAIPADLLEGYGGGISMQQYEQIKKLSGIELAAPIAFLGYVQVPVPEVQFVNTALPPGYYRIDWTLTAFDGRHSIIERQEHAVWLISSNCAAPLASPALQPLQQQGLHFQCGSNADSSNTFAFASVDTGTFLLAAIDPAAENQLVHLDGSIIGGRMLTEQDTLALDAGSPYASVSVPGSSTIYKVPEYDIPLLIQQGLPGQITARANFARIAPESLSLDQVQAQGGMSYLEHLTNAATLFQGTVPLLENNPQEFSEAVLTWNGRSWQVGQYDKSGAGAGLSFLYTPSSLTYQRATSPTGQPDAAYTLVPNGVQGPEVAFRALQALHVSQIAQPPFYSAFYRATPIGQFSGSRLTALFSNPLNWLPESTYSSPPTVFRYDAQGHPVAPTALLPTTNPAGYSMQPPLALTTLTAAEHLLGNNFISAIRVRVAGVDAADPDSWGRIQQVAQSIEQRTGLHVLVTLGASPTPVLVFVPGVTRGHYGATQDIAPIGWVEERWIVSGASIVYLSQLSETRLILLGTVLLVCLGYLVVTLSALASSRRREFAILSSLGWPPWQPARQFLLQTGVLALGGGSVGIGLALLISRLLGAIPVWGIVAWALPVVLGLAALSSCAPLWQIWHIRPAEILRAGTVVVSEKAARRGEKLWAFLPPVVSVALRNLARTRSRTLIAWGSLCISTALLVVMSESLLALRQTLQGTFLGNYVLLQTTIPQLAGIIFAVLLTFLSVADLLLLQVRERLQEVGLLQAVGWRAVSVQRLFVQEGLILAVIGALPGAGGALWALALRQDTQRLIPTPLVGLAAILLMLGVAATATIPAVRLIGRMRVIEVLRSE